ncbi:helix-turn-helix domain-containing protein [Mucilaginibacter sp. RS28]|uniref:Helix-turn-helix domain-containing protein n=1 Tax=Mucilaginibacter straminoryzae TaxID=2932774 RepID=A0A9X1X6G1_9SPHI|nr:helix-turn-helix transcriptional regulator [Mucilaginibacter straminoryzae]MCJ8210538.1 helix-turn-helix domain-containing protein [Mucilaginibacter straminoryzae]
MKANHMSRDVANKIKSVASNIRRVREGKGYTQEYLAMKLGISQNAYSKIELGYTKITLERLFQVAQLLETNVLTLMDEPVLDGHNENNRYHRPAAL